MTKNNWNWPITAWNEYLVMSTGWLIQSFSSTSVMVARHRGSGCNSQQIINMRSNKNKNKVTHSTNMNYFIYTSHQKQVGTVTWLWRILSSSQFVKPKPLLTRQSQSTQISVNYVSTFKWKQLYGAYCAKPWNLTSKIKSSAIRSHLNKTLVTIIYDNYFAFEPVRYSFLFHKCSYQRIVSYI